MLPAGLSAYIVGGRIKSTSLESENFSVQDISSGILNWLISLRFFLKEIT